MDSQPRWKEEDAIFSQWEDARFKNQNRGGPALESARIREPGTQNTPAHSECQPPWGGKGEKVSIEGESFLKTWGWKVNEWCRVFSDHRTMGDLNANSGPPKLERQCPNAFAMNASPVVAAVTPSPAAIRLSTGMFGEEKKTMNDSETLRRRWCFAKAGAVAVEGKTTHHRNADLFWDHGGQHHLNDEEISTEAGEAPWTAGWLRCQDLLP